MLKNVFDYFYKQMVHRNLDMDRDAKKMKQEYEDKIKKMKLGHEKDVERVSAKLKQEKESSMKEMNKM